jgi:hypothetical protein
VKLFLVALVAALVTSCTAAEMQFWRVWHNTTSSCHGAVDYLWPAESRSWAHRIVDRESGGDPRAQNPSSSAAGCAQLLKMHAWRFSSTGTSWAHRYDAKANIAAALHLYREAGASPWAL